MNRENERQTGEIIVVLESREREFTVEDADFVYRRLDQMWRGVFQLTQVNTIPEDVFSGISSDRISSTEVVGSSERSRCKGRMYPFAFGLRFPLDTPQYSHREEGGGRITRRDFPSHLKISNPSPCLGFSVLVVKKRTTINETRMQVEI